MKVQRVLEASVHCLLVTAFFIAAVEAAAVCDAPPTPAGPEPPADVALFGEQPATFHDEVTPFPLSGGIFQYREEGDDPITRLKFQEVANLRNPLGHYSARVSGFGKYIFVGNGDSVGVFGADPTVFSAGVFDTESKEYCSLELTPYGDPVVPGANAHLLIPNPTGRKSRLVFAPGGSGSDEIVFGYIRADLDVEDPCTSWNTAAGPAIVRTGADFEDLCKYTGTFGEQYLCSFDTVAILGHQEDGTAGCTSDEFGCDFVMLGQYWGGGRIGVVRIDSSGIDLVDTYQVQPFVMRDTESANPEGTGGACFSASPARPPASDFMLPPDMRPSDDWRFLVSYDPFFQDKYSYPHYSLPSGCADPVPYCALDDPDEDGIVGEPCPASGVCTATVCRLLPTRQCVDDTDCFSLFGPLGPCEPAPCVVDRNPFLYCAGDPQARPCRDHDNCDTGVGELCLPAGLLVSGVVARQKPAQEFRFDPTANTISPTSGKFHKAVDETLPPPQNDFEGVSPSGSYYDSDGSVWAGGFIKGTHELFEKKNLGESCTINGQAVPVDAGLVDEHCFYDPSNPAESVFVMRDGILEDFEATTITPYQARALEVGDNKMFVVNPTSVQASRKVAGEWSEPVPADYKVGFAFAKKIASTDPLACMTVPIEPKRCSSLDDLGCNSDTDPPGCGTCTGLGEDGLGPEVLVNFKTGVVGGAPASIWVQSGYRYTGGSPPLPQTNAFLLRVPIATQLTESIAQTRPSIAWYNGRLWLVAEQNGELRYRVRDDGQWSTWHSLAPNNISTVGGGSIVAGVGIFGAPAGGTGVAVFARDVAGTVYHKHLVSPQTCEPGSCNWSTWIPVAAAGNVQTQDDFSVTLFAGIVPVVVVRGTDDSVRYTLNFFGWVDWQRAGILMRTEDAPSATYHGPDQGVWVAARLKSNDQLMFTKIDVPSLTNQPWAQVPMVDAPPGWRAPAAIVSDGTSVRLFAHSSDGAGNTYQSVNHGAGWSAWREPLGGSAGTRQPAAANVFGEVNLVTYWFTNGLQELVFP